jgi:hypothetical protein
MPKMHRLLPHRLSAPGRLPQGLSRRHDAIAPLLEWQRRVEEKGFTYDRCLRLVQWEPEQHAGGKAFMNDYNKFMAQLTWISDRAKTLTQEDTPLYRIDIQLYAIRYSF